MSAQESAYVRWNEAVQKFDYYLVGIIGAGLVLLLKDLRIEHYGFTADCVRAAGIFCLLISFIAGLIRLERFHMFLRFEHERLVRAPYRDAIKSGNKNVVRESDYQVMSQEEVQTFESQLDANHARLKAGTDRTTRVMAKAYSVRSWSLFIGLILLFAGAFIPRPKLVQTTLATPTSASLPQAASVATITDSAPTQQSTNPKQ